MKMRDKKDFSRAENDYLESKYICERNKGQKTFADFVDKVIRQIPAKKIDRKISFCQPSESNDPLMVLRSRGLVDIESSSIEAASSTSEVDLTLYTEESRIGNVVKVFSSTHRFKNGRLVYSTTQEACPQLDEEIGSFNRWWKSQGPGQQKSINAKEPSFQNTYTRKKLCDLFRDIQKQEIIKRYERARKKDPVSCKTAPSMEMARFKKQLTFKAKNPVIPEEEVISRKMNAQTGCLPRCEKIVTRNLSSDSSRAEKNRDLQNKSSGGKVTFRASWLHRSPRKGQRSSSGNLIENRERNLVHFGCDSSQETTQNKATRVLKASELQSSTSATRIPPSRLPNRNSSSSSDRGMLLKSPSIIGNSEHTDSNKSFKQNADYKKSRYPFPCEQSDSPSKHFNVYHKRAPLHANADFEENGNNSSDNNTSVCTIFYEANGDWINEGQESRIYKSHQDEGKYHSKNPIKTVEGQPRTSSKFSHKCSTGISRHIHAQEDSDNCIKCFAKCHTKHQDEHEVSIMTGIVSNHNNDEYEDDKYEAIKAIENFVNEEALEKFSKRCGDSIDKSNCKVLNTVARQQFYEEISNFCQQDRNNEYKKRK